MTEGEQHFRPEEGATSTVLFGGFLERMQVNYSPCAVSRPASYGFRVGSGGCTILWAIVFSGGGEGVTKTFCNKCNTGRQRVFTLSQCLLWLCKFTVCSLPCAFSVWFTLRKKRWQRCVSFFVFQWLPHSLIRRY